MRIGQTVRVGDVDVLRLNDCEWHARKWLPDGTTLSAWVTEDPLDPDLHGEAWATDAVRDAEQVFDLTEADPFIELERSPRPEWVNRKAVSVRRGELC